MDMNPTDPLDKVFTSEKAVDNQLLADILSPYVRINIEDNTIWFNDEGNALPIPTKLALFLVARKALKLRNQIETEGVSPADIIKDTQLKEGSVHPGLKSLKEASLIAIKEGKYFVPNHQLNKIKSIFIKKENNGA